MPSESFWRASQQCVARRVTSDGMCRRMRTEYRAMSTQGQGTGVVDGDGGMPHPPSEARRPRASEAMPRDGDVESMDVSFYISFWGICFMTLQIPMVFAPFKRPKMRVDNYCLKHHCPQALSSPPFLQDTRAGTGAWTISTCICPININDENPKYCPRGPSGGPKTHRTLAGAH